MLVQQPGSEPHLRREWWIAAAVLVFLVLARSLVFVFWEGSYFDSDQAIVGLMAKHLVEGRAFPVFYYGQNYMLGVEAYLAAPVFALAGVSVTTLKLPLLAVNIGIVLLLLGALVRDVGLRPFHALVPALFLAVPSPGVTADILAANGGNVAPFAYVLLIWVTRNRPNWCGLVFALGFLQREFTLYGLAALLTIEAFEGRWRTRAGLRHLLTVFRSAAEVWLVVQVLKQHSSAAGPGTTMADLMRPRDNLLELTDRWCGDVTALPRGLGQLFTEHWPILFGTRPTPLADLSIASTGTQGIPGSFLIVAAAVLLPIGAIAYRLAATREWRREYTFCAYLVLVALFSQAGYIVGRCGHLSYLTLRYELLSVLGVVGLGAWFLRVASRPRLRLAWMGLACASVMVAAVPHARLLTEYVRHAPEDPKRLLARHLESRGIKYAVGDYWRAYAVTFLTDERVIVASGDFQRIREYQTQVEAHRDEAVRIAREYCPGGRPVLPGVWVCPYGR